MVLQCVAAEAPTLLPPLLFLHCLTQVRRCQCAALVVHLEKRGHTGSCD